MNFFLFCPEILTFLWQHLNDICIIIASIGGGVRHNMGGCSMKGPEPILKPCIFCWMLKCQNKKVHIFKPKNCSYFS